MTRVILNSSFFLPSPCCFVLCYPSIIHLSIHPPTPHHPGFCLLDCLLSCLAGSPPVCPVLGPYIHTVALAVSPFQTITSLSVFFFILGDLVPYKSTECPLPPNDAWLLLSCSLKWLGTPLVPPGVSWCLLVSPGVSWCLLVPPGASWCLLVSPGVSWCLPHPDVSEGGAWCLFLLPNFLLVQTRFFFISPWTESPNIAALSAVLGRQCPSSTSACREKSSFPP